MAYTNEIYSNDTGELFIQLNGPGHDVSWVPCVDVGDIDHPRGDVNREMCPDPNKRGHWIPVLRTKGADGEATFDLTVKSGKYMSLLDMMSTNDCKTPFYLLQRSCGPRTTFLPFDKAIVLPAGLLTGEGRSNVSMSNGDGSAPTGATETMSISAENMITAFKLAPTVRVTTETEAGLDLALYKKSSCIGVCGGYQEACQYQYIGAAAAAAAIANFLHSTDGGVTWAVAAGPFIADEDISSVVSFENGLDVRTVLVACGTLKAAAPAEVSWTVDDGTTWHDVNVGSTNTEFFPWNGCLFALDARHVWACTDTGGGAAGNIYFSGDAGKTWTLMGSGGDALNCIKFASEAVGLCVGDTNEILLTIDQGNNWTSITGPAAMAAVDAISCIILDDKRFWVGYEGGQIYSTENGGATWTARTIGQPATATAISAINDMVNIDDHCFFIAIEWTDGADVWHSVERSIAGGEEDTWEIYTNPTADDAALGTLSVDACSYNFAACTGGPIGALASIMTVGHIAG